MKWGPKFREFRFSCVYNRFGSFLDKLNQYNIELLSTAAATAWKCCVHTVTVALCCNTRTHIERWISTLLDGSQTLIMNVGLQEFLELTQSIRNPGNKVVHPTEICNYTRRVLTVKRSVLLCVFEILDIIEWRWHCSTDWPSFLSASRRFWNSVWKISRCFSMRTCSHLRASSSCVLSWRYTCTLRCSSSNRASACTHNKKCTLKNLIKPNFP